MTKERAMEIETKTIYAQINNMPFDTIDVVSAFYVGKMVGKIQSALHEELQKEVEDENYDYKRKYQEITKIANPLKRLSFDEMSDVERGICEVLEDKENL
jgi:hypothetical protein